MAAAILDAAARGDIESTQTTEVSGIELPTNARVLVTHTSANRDERCPDVMCGSYQHSAADMRSIETVY